jgi:hypothetical protein
MTWRTAARLQTEWVDLHQRRQPAADSVTHQRDVDLTEGQPAACERKPMTTYRFGNLEGTLFRPNESGPSVHDRLSGHYLYGLRSLRMSGRE